MALVSTLNKPQGLTPVKYLSGNNWDGRGRMYHIDSGDTNAYYVGDPVSLKAGTATITGEDAGLPTLTVGQVGATNVGVHIVPVSFGSACEHRTFAHDPRGSVTDARKTASGNQPIR